MIRKVYQVSIAASKEKCADVMLGLTDKSTYEAWTKVFNPTSTYDGSWDLGSKIKFSCFAQYLQCHIKRNIDLQAEESIYKHQAYQTNR